MLQAMNTGHDGSITTVHSNSPRDTLARIETMTLMAGFDLPVRAIREQMASALDLIVHISRLRDGTRRITHITEVQGMEGDVITLQDVFLFDYGMGVDEHGRFRGHLKATGVRPEVRREARRPRHPPRPRGLRARGVRPQGSGRTMSRRRRRDDGRRRSSRVAVALFAVLAPTPAGAQTSGPRRRRAPAHQVQLARVNSTDPSKVDVVFRYDGAASDVAGLDGEGERQGRRADRRATPLGQAQSPARRRVRRRHLRVDRRRRDARREQERHQGAGRSAPGRHAGRARRGRERRRSWCSASPPTMPRSTSSSTSLTPQGDGAMWEGVVRGASVITDVPAMVGSMVVVTDGNTGTGTPFTDAKGAVIAAGTTVDSFGVQGGKLGGEAQRARAGRPPASTARRTRHRTSPVSWPQPFRSSPGCTTSRTHRATTKGVNDLTLTVGDATTRGTYVVGSDARGASALAYQPPTESTAASRRRSRTASASRSRSLSAFWPPCSAPTPSSASS